MSNPCMIEVRHFEDESLILVSDDYGKTFATFDLPDYDSHFSDVYDLLEYVSQLDEMDGSFSVVESEDGTLSVELDACSSVEVYGFERGSDPGDLSFLLMRGDNDA